MAPPYFPGSRASVSIGGHTTCAAQSESRAGSSRNSDGPCCPSALDLTARLRTRGRGPVLQARTVATTTQQLGACPSSETPAAGAE